MTPLHSSFFFSISSSFCSSFCPSQKENPVRRNSGLRQRAELDTTLLGRAGILGKNPFIHLGLPFFKAQNYTFLFSFFFSSPSTPHTLPTDWATPVKILSLSTSLHNNHLRKTHHCLLFVLLNSLITGFHNSFHFYPTIIRSTHSSQIIF